MEEKNKRMTDNNREFRGLLDNKTSGHVGYQLKKHSFSRSRLSVLSSLFTLYGFASLRHELKQLESARIIFSEWDSTNLQNLVGSDSDVRLLNQLQQKHIASDSQWLANKAEVKASVRPQPGQNIFILGLPSKVLPSAAVPRSVQLGLATCTATPCT
ncbi:hypothetical protein ACVXHB_20210 [Escherichia coli]